MSADSLVFPLFIREGTGIVEDLPCLPGLKRYSPDTVNRAIDEAMGTGVQAFLLFGIPEHKDELGSCAWAEDGVVQQGIREIKKQFPEAILIADVCLCEYTSHGHCGIPTQGSVDNDKTLALLAKSALSFAEAGVDIVAPSDMMDGRVAAIRAMLDQHDLTNVAIMSYAVKYASSFYGPFREAAGTTSGFGDRKSYQMDWHNRREALKEMALDLDEGADYLIVKPALSYMDIISDVKASCAYPVAAYSVSGEYSMIKAAASQGLVDGYGIMCETATSMYRAGTDILISYFAPELAMAMRKGDIG